MYERLHPLWISFSLLSTFDEKWFEIDGSGSRLRKHKEIDKHLVKLIEYIETLCASSSIDHLKSIFFDCPSSPCPDCPDCPASYSLSWCPACLLVHLSPAHPHMSHIHLRCLSQLSRHTQVWVHSTQVLRTLCIMFVSNTFLFQMCRSPWLELAYSRYKIRYISCSFHF